MVTGGTTEITVVKDPKRDVVRVTVVPGRTCVCVKNTLSVSVVAETCVTVDGGTMEMIVVNDPERDVVRVIVVPGRI
jgi:hypothetical protein